MSAVPSKPAPRGSSTGATPKQASAALPAQQGPQVTRRAQPSRSAATATFDDARLAIDSIEAAYRFLTERELVPALDGEGTGEDIRGACTTQGLVTGLQHFARTAPDKALAAKGLLAFALYAEAACAAHNASTLAAPLSESVQSAVRDCMEGHVDRMENAFLSAAEKLDKAAEKLNTGAEAVEAAAERMAQAETKLAAAENAITLAKEAYNRDWPPLQSAQLTGAPPAPNPAPCTTAPPAQAQRALVNRDLLGRQLLVRGVALKDQQGANISSAEARAKGKLTLEMMAKEQDLHPPQEVDITDVKIMHEDVVFTFSTHEAAVWLLQPDVAHAFAARMGDKAQVVARRYKVVAEMVPISFDPMDGNTLRELEERHGLRPRAITRADWIKAPYRRAPGQRFAHVLMEFEDDDQANIAIGGLKIAGRCILVRRNIEEPRRCLRCQGYDGHIARECPAPHETCATCGGEHTTADCRVAEQEFFYCCNCAEYGHAAWDRANCGTHAREVRSMQTKRADSGFRFFVTDKPETWIPSTAELESDRARLNLLWDRIAPRLPLPETRAQRQTRLDEAWTSTQGSQRNTAGHRTTPHH